MSEMYNYISQWLRLAENDLISANHLLSLHPYKLEVICYLCEQKCFGINKMKDIGMINYLLQRAELTS
jgi:hypothetical protein